MFKINNEDTERCHKICEAFQRDAKKLSWGKNGLVQFKNNITSQ